MNKFSKELVKSLGEAADHAGGQGEQRSASNRKAAKF